MDDLRERFKVLDEVTVPEHASSELETRMVPEDRAHGVRRAGTAAFALVVAVASFAFVVRALAPQDEERPVDAGPEPLDVDVGSPVRVGDNPNAVVVGGGGVWVSALPADGNERSLVRLNPMTGDVVARIAVPALPTWEVGGGGIVALPDAVWVTGAVDAPEARGCCDAIVFRVDPATNTVAEVIDLGPGFGADVWVDGSGVWVLKFREESLGPNDVEVVRLDPASYEELARIPLPTDWAKQVFAFDGSIWVHGNREDSPDAVVPDVLFRIDPVTNRSAGSVALPSQEFPLAVDGASIWQRTPDGVARVDPEGPQVAVALQGMQERCCSHVASDGEGGLWVLSRLTPDRLRVAHVTPDGDVDRSDEDDAPPSLFYAVSVALDHDQRTLWIAQYRHTVIPIRLRPA
jgi:hypothetical protein